MKTIVVIPTYDEKDNVATMAAAVLHQGDEIEVLFCDDNSPDGTGEILDRLAAENARVHVMHRERKEGLGRAYIAGFREAMAMGAEKIIQMDCDFSHDPKDISRLIAADADCVIGSRYVKGGKTVGWPFKRLLISRLGGLFIRTVTGMPIKDPTGGFKCWKVSTLKTIDYETVESAGYSFQLEMNHRTWFKGLKIVELPIVFAERQAGYSKITTGIAVESVKIVLKLWRKVRFRRTPRI